MTEEGMVKRALMYEKIETFIRTHDKFKIQTYNFTGSIDELLNCNVCDFSIDRIHFTLTASYKAKSVLMQELVSFFYYYAGGDIEEVRKSFVDI